MLSHPWQAPGTAPLSDIRQSARAELDWILSEHEPEPLERACQGELRAILAAAEREAGRITY